MAEKDTSSRGFGSMDDERQREVASEGGHAAQEKGTGQLTPDEARRGGEAVSSDRRHMSEIGRKGGEHSQGGGSMEEDNESGSERGGSHRNSMRGGTPDQHAEAGRQSHKNQGQSEERNQGHSQKAVRTIVSLTRAMAKKLVAIHQSNMLRQVGKVTKTADLFRQSAD